jgi:hypothetical protein
MRRRRRDKWNKHISRTAPEIIAGNIRGNCPAGRRKNCDNTPTGSRFNNSKRQYCYRQMLQELYETTLLQADVVKTVRGNSPSDRQCKNCKRNCSYRQTF